MTHCLKPTCEIRQFESITSPQWRNQKAHLLVLFMDKIHNYPSFHFWNDEENDLNIVILFYPRMDNTPSRTLCKGPFYMHHWNPFSFPQYLHFHEKLLLLHGLGIVVVVVVLVVVVDYTSGNQWFCHSWSIDSNFKPPLPWKNYHNICTNNFLNPLLFHQI